MIPERRAAVEGQVLGQPDGQADRGHTWHAVLGVPGPGPATAGSDGRSARSSGGRRTRSEPRPCPVRRRCARLRARPVPDHGLDVVQASRHILGAEQAAPDVDPVALVRGQLPGRGRGPHGPPGRTAGSSRAIHARPVPGSTCVGQRSWMWASTGVMAAPPLTSSFVFLPSGGFRGSASGRDTALRGHAVIMAGHHVLRAAVTSSAPGPSVRPFGPRAFGYPLSLGNHRVLGVGGRPHPGLEDPQAGQRRTREQCRAAQRRHRAAATAQDRTDRVPRHHPPGSSAAPRGRPPPSRRTPRGQRIGVRARSVRPAPPVWPTPTTAWSPKPLKAWGRPRPSAGGGAWPKRLKRPSGTSRQMTFTSGGGRLEDQ
jgi:hypothetical protein